MSLLGNLKKITINIDITFILLVSKFPLMDKI